MFWTMTALAVVLAAAALAVAGKWVRNRRAGAGSMAAAGDPYGSLYGLTAEEAARFHQAVRERGRLHRARWSRDYLPGVPDAALPGRVSGIPRALRVRR